MPTNDWIDQMNRLADKYRDLDDRGIVEEMIMFLDQTRNGDAFLTFLRKRADEGAFTPKPVEEKIG